MGKLLPFKRIDSNQDDRLSKRNSAATGDCRPCLRKPTCIPKSKSHKITRTAYDTHYRRALAQQQSWPRRRMRRLEQRTIKPGFGSLLQHYGLRCVDTRGRSSAHKTMLLNTITFNLKKLLKHQPKRTIPLAIPLPKPLLQGPLLGC